MFNGPIYVSLLPIQCHDTFCLISFYMFGMMIRVLHSVEMCMSRMLFHFMRCDTKKSDRKSTHIERGKNCSRLPSSHPHNTCTSIAQYAHTHYLMRSFRGAYLFSVVFNVCVYTFLFISVNN